MTLVFFQIEDETKVLVTASTKIADEARERGLVEIPSPYNEYDGPRVSARMLSAAFEQAVCSRTGPNTFSGGEHYPLESLEREKIYVAEDRYITLAHKGLRARVLDCVYSTEYASEQFYAAVAELLDGRVAIREGKFVLL